MRTACIGLCGLILAGCGLDETYFVPDYADRYCEAMLACASPAQLTFEGITGQDDCLGLVGPDIDAWGEGCKYKAGKAKKCLKAMEALACPAEGQTLDDVLPIECDEVYIQCAVTAGDDDDDDDSKSTEETGLP